MSAVKSGSTLRTLVLTPERILDFLIPSRSPLLFLSPRLQRTSPDRTRLLSDHDDDDDSPSPGPSPRPSPGPSPSMTPLSPAPSRPHLLRLPPRIRRPRHTAAESADTDVTTQAAMSLSHVDKVTTPYGFTAVLAASPCTRRRESLFHHNKPNKQVTVTVTDTDLRDQVAPPPGPGPSPSPSPSPGPSRTRVSLQPVRALGLQVIKELKKPAAALKALSPAMKRTRPR